MSSAGHRRYVAGFLFHAGRVLLVRKTHPAWQANLMNGVGGGIERGETASMAMRREFREEAGLDIEAWDYFAIEHGPGYEVLFFRYFLHNSPLEKQTKTNTINDAGEDLEWCDPVTPKYPLIGNLNWLLPLALDPRPIRVTVRTTGDIRKLMTW